MRPAWLKRKLKAVLSTGTLNLDGENITDLSVVPFVSYLKELILSFTPITSFSGLPAKMKLENIVLDSSQLENFENASAISHVTKISLYNTPVSKIRNFKLSLVIMCGDNLRVIDGCTVSDHLRKRAAAYPPVCRRMIDAGWVAEYPCPSDDVLADICGTLGISPDSDAKGGDYMGDIVAERDVEDMISAYWESHKHLIDKAKGILSAPPTENDALKSSSEDDDETPNSSSLAPIHADVDTTRLSYRVIEALRKHDFEIRDGASVDEILSALSHVFAMAEGNVQSFPDFGEFADEDDVEAE